MKNEISKKNPYWIPKHRYLELKNWCLQYPDWAKFISNVHYAKSKIPWAGKSQNFSDPVGDLAVFINAYSRDMDLIENICNEVAHDFYVPFLNSIVTGKSYDSYTATAQNLYFPSRSEWYKAYRKFFYILSQKRD